MRNNSKNFDLPTLRSWKASTNPLLDAIAPMIQV